MRNRKVFAGAMLAVAAVTLGGCQQEPASPQATEAAPDAKPGLAVANARLVLPAVKGNPAAVYFDVTNNGYAETELAGVAVTGAAETMMHDTVTEGGVSRMVMLDALRLAKGASASFAPGGKHVMAMDLDPALAAGGETEITLTFAGGDKVSVMARIEAPGGGHGAEGH